MRGFIMVLTLSLSFLRAQTTSPLHWRPLGEPGVGGAIVSLQVSPHDSRHLIATGDMLSVAVSFDGGDSWQPCAGDQFPSYEMCDTTFHPADPQVIWMGTCMGPFKSSDRGLHWQSKRTGMPGPIPGRYHVMIQKILFHPHDNRHLFAFGGSARHWNQADTFGWVWESRDGGESWQHIATLDGSGYAPRRRKGKNIWFAAFQPGTCTLHILADDTGWWSSSDNGRTWRRHQPRGITSPITGLTFHPTDPQIMWITTHNYRAGDTPESIQPGGVFKSTDGGESFRPADQGIVKVNARNGNRNLTSWFKPVALSPANPDILYVNDQAWNAAVIYKSMDGGRSWLPCASRRGIGRNAHPLSKKCFPVETACFAGICMRLVVDPNDPRRVYGFNSSFVLRSVDGGHTWDDASSFRPDPTRKDHWRGRGWSGWCSTNVAYNPFRKGQCIVQGLDACRGWISDDALQTWHYARGQTHPWQGGQDVTFCRDGTIYITTGQFGSSNGIQRSRDWGQTWTTLAGPKHNLPPAGWGNHQEFAGIHADPRDSRLVWAVLQGKLIHSRDGGETWAVVPGIQEANYFASDPTDPNRFYLKTNAGILVTDDNGQTFRNIGLPRTSPRSRINCDARGRVLVCQWRKGRGGLWRYDRESGQWRRLLDEDQAFECNADPSDPTRLLLVTSMDPFYENAGGHGIWISHDDGKSWARANHGIGMLRATACAFNPFAPEEIIVGTNGMGFFRTSWPKSYRPAATRSYQHNEEDTNAAMLHGSLLDNGSMLEGTGKPKGWHQVWGKLSIMRDTSTYKHPPASLHAVCRGSHGMVFQQLRGYAGQTLRLSGWLKTAGQAKVNVAIQCFDASWKKNKFLQVHYSQGKTAWTKFDKAVTLPSWTSRFNVLLLIEGHGEAWLDEVKLVPSSPVD